MNIPWYPILSMCFRRVMINSSFVMSVVSFGSLNAVANSERGRKAAYVELCILIDGERVRLPDDQQVIDTL